MECTVGEIKCGRPSTPGVLGKVVGVEFLEIEIALIAHVKTYVHPIFEPQDMPACEENCLSILTEFSSIMTKI